MLDDEPQRAGYRVAIARVMKHIERVFDTRDAKTLVVQQGGTPGNGTLRYSEKTGEPLPYPEDWKEAPSNRPMRGLLRVDLGGIGPDAGGTGRTSRYHGDGSGDDRA
ncbi:hypothetical protein OJF2_32290 [Aquisphaera giovannonii]|uniref:Uncharacterized protein n=1 Tax=Aquisphaera giovannonii TaxID=406548 RepID=A0A5B9W2B0_9BACT|nr:hypothetical protein [Aquisphaera giovannonii]QEH34688.1 hypothetical protein OJF2_32290 [Aquisphaera giovannonii]